MRERSLDVKHGKALVKEHRSRVPFDEIGNWFRKPGRPGFGFFIELVGHNFNSYMKPQIIKDAPAPAALLNWPDCCNAGVVLRVLLVVNACVLIPALLDLQDPTPWAERMAQSAMLTEPATLITLLLLCGLRQLIIKMSSALPVSQFTQPLQWLLAMAVAFLVTWGIDALALGWWRNLLGLSQHPLHAVYAGLAAALLTFIFLHYFDLRSKAFSPALNEARLTALTARIRPHFFFNSLNTVLALIRSEPRKAENTLEDLAELLRTLMRDARQQVSLQEELTLCERYLNIERTRLGERLSIQWDIASGLGQTLVPSLLLQPLLENAVHHGVEVVTQGGWIHVSIAPVNEQLQIIVENSRVPGVKSQPGNGLAMDNIRERLALQYDLTAQLLVDDQPDHYTVTVNLPLQS